MNALDFIRPWLPKDYVLMDLDFLRAKQPDFQFKKKNKIVI